MSSRDRAHKAFDAHRQGSGHYNQPGSSKGQVAPNQLSEDEALARRLQEQFDLESREPSRNDAAAQASHSGIDNKSARVYDSGAFTKQPLVDSKQEFDQDFDPVSAALPYTTDYFTDLSSLQAFAKQAAQVGCSKCTGKLLHSKITPQDITKLWFEKKHLNSNSAVKCPGCSTYTCIGCGITPLKAAPNQANSGGWALTWCCDQGRLFIIWVLLCFFDQHHLNNAAQSKAKASSSSKVANPLPTPNKAGTGFGGNRGGLWPSRFADSLSDANDDIVQRVTNFLEMIWPGSPESSTGPFDTHPPSVLLTMVSNSFLLDRTASLLRNDSIEDVSKRADLYDKVLSWVGAAGSHPFTANLVVDERTTRTDGLSLLQISFGETTSATKGKGRDEKSPSIAKCLEDLTTQSRMLVKNLEKSKGKQSEQTHNTLNICKGILIVAGMLNKYIPIQVVTPRNPANAWEQWQRDKAVSDISDQEMLSQHVFARQAKGLSHSPKDRIPRIVRELANIKTSLPPGIFVRHATNRVDVWKVLIIGPSNTPYEHGLFEFDVFFPAHYPVGPPLFYFVTAGRYRMSINPNLHPDGKICLSLLNTWPGPKWNPSHSTPLQVLVSIQAMVFCEEPWYNEPGYENYNMSKNPSAMHKMQTYNTRISATIVQYCMLPWFQDQGIWGEVVAQHFRTNKQQMIDTTQRWAREEAERGVFGMLPPGLIGFGDTGMADVIKGGPGMKRSLKDTAKELQQLLDMI